MLTIAFIIMAAGNSSRFGKNKLIQPLWGKPLFSYVLEETEKAAYRLMNASDICREAKKPERIRCRIQVVTRTPAILEAVSGRAARDEALWSMPVNSPESQEGISVTIRNGIGAVGDSFDYYLFLTADQPCLRAASICRLIRETLESGKGLGSMRHQGEPGNPVLFHRGYLPQLLALSGDGGGRKILGTYPQDCWYCELQQGRELMDADTADALSRLENSLANPDKS